MNKEQQIEHWMDIIRAVFAAEDSLPEQWKDKLRSAKGLPAEERSRIADEYVRAIATEIIENSGLSFEDGAVEEELTN